MDTETLVDCERVPDEMGTDEVFDENTLDAEVVFETETVVLRLEIDDCVFEDDKTELDLL